MEEPYASRQLRRGHFQPAGSPSGARLSSRLRLEAKSYLSYPTNIHMRVSICCTHIDLQYNYITSWRTQRREARESVVSEAELPQLRHRVQHSHVAHRRAHRVERHQRHARAVRGGR